MKYLSILILFLLFSLTSCSYFAYYYQTGSSSQLATSSESVKIHSGDIDQNYVVIGSVTAEVAGDANKAASYLKQKASELGANAIINAELTKMHSFAQRTGISGVAVRVQ